MGRIKPAWYYERQKEEAEKREAYYRNRQAPPTGTTVKSRGASTDLFYRSLTQRLEAEPIIYRVGVTNDTLSRLTAAEAGLKNTLADGEIALRLRGTA